MKNRFIYTIALVIFFLTDVNAQQVEFNRAELENGGRSEKYKDVGGSPYLLENWSLGSAKTIDNLTKKNVQLKYDEIEDILMIKGDGNTLQIFPVQVAEFSIYDYENKTTRTFRSGFAATKINTNKSFFEVIADGKLKLLKKNHKVISQNKEYSGAVTKTIKDGFKYYLVINDNIPSVVKLDIKSINTLLPDKQIQLTEYAKINNLNLKNHEDAARLINYYNTL